MVPYIILKSVNKFLENVSKSFRKVPKKLLEFFFL